MVELGTTAALAVQLEESREQLAAISRRVAEAAQSAPRGEAGRWEGAAAKAYQHALERLSRELEGAQELLRSATDLTTAALYEVGAHA